MKKKYFLFFILFVQFAVFAQNTFQEHSIATSSNSYSNLNVIDLDHDGDLDILVSAYNGNKIVWFKNLDGLGTFSGELFISNSITSPRSVHAVDIDSDGDLDVLSGSTIGVAWYENLDGLGSFGEAQLTNIDSVSPFYVYGSDVDGDADVDIFVANGNVVFWHENLDGDVDFEQNGNQVYYYYDIYNYANNVVFDDLDSDNDIDFMRAVYYSDYVAWKKNNGDGTFSGGGIIGGSAFAYGLYASDLDNDGDKDVIIGTDDYTLHILHWHENIEGDFGGFGSGQEVEISTGAAHVNANDIDGDGDNDIISTTMDEHLVKWYENLDGMGNFGEEQIIGSLTEASGVSTADLDNDGDNDVIVLGGAFNSAGTLVWYENIDAANNSISGTVNYNLDDTNCSADNIPLSNILVSTSGSEYTFSTSIQQNGNYFLEANQDVFVTEVSSNLPDYYTVTPENTSYDFTGLENTNANVDFCVTGNQVINDLEISIYPSINIPRPGFNTSYQIVYKNFGTTELTGTITFEFDDTKLQFLTASEPILSQTTNSIIFDYSLLNPLEVQTIDLEFNVFPPPTTNIGDNLVSTVAINPISGDNTEDNNVFVLEQTVIGSYDPNDIAVLEGEEILIEDVDKYLHYVIRFQNTGTASAINIKVDNILDNNLDWSTLNIESYSHNGHLEIRQEKMLSFIFNDINLPDSSSDEENSHGFITYKIKPKADIEMGDIIFNRADIFFDFNPAIYTNTVSTIIVEALSLDDYDLNELSIYPNPTYSVLNIKSKTKISKVLIYDINGRLLSSELPSNEELEYQLDVSNLSAGLYFLEIQSDNSKQTKKFVKK